MKVHEPFITKLKVYLITNRHVLPPGRDLVQAIEDALKGGVMAVQLREKDLGSRELFGLAEELRAVTAKYGALLFINDRVDIARAVRADGVHLGGHSMPVDVVKSLVGQDLLIGVSTHSLAELDDAINSGADFVTFGPVYPTLSKVRYGAPVGVQALREACRMANEFPVLALGGINPDRIQEVLSAGARGIGVVSAIMSAHDPGQAAWSLCKSFSP